MREQTVAHARLDGLSLKARKILGMPQEASVTRASNDELAARFFFGGVATVEALRAGYAGLV
jgi:hypothetical protein